MNDPQPILILSDNDKFARVLEVNLREFGPTASFLVNNNAAQSPEAEPKRLLIIALSTSESEPLLALSRASLLGQAWHAPVLVISDRAFPSDPRHHLYHLLFPFATEDLRLTLRKILGHETRV